MSLRARLAVSAMCSLLWLTTVTRYSVAQSHAPLEAQYRVDAVQPISVGLSRIQLTVYLTNVSGAPLNNARLELLGSPPARRAQDFGQPISLPDSATTTLTDAFTVNAIDAERWRSGGAAPPTLIVIGTDASGHLARRPVEVVSPTGPVR
jgi:hypothetical protein